jgi:hypothetical protein
VNAILRARVASYYEHQAVNDLFNDRVTLDVQVGGTGRLSRLVLLAGPCTRHVPLTSTQRAFVSPFSSCSQPMADLMSDLWRGFNAKMGDTPCQVSLRATKVQHLVDSQLQIGSHCVCLILTTLLLPPLVRVICQLSLRSHTMVESEPMFVKAGELKVGPYGQSN